MVSTSQLLTEWCEKIGVSVGSMEKQQIFSYLEELVDWNGRVNLVARASKEEILRKHFVDSLSLTPFIPEKDKFGLAPFIPEKDKFGCGTLRLLDIGTGAGFPGLVLKIVRPDVLAHLLESSQKKCLFLKHIISILAMAQVEILNGRAEIYGHSDGYRESYDVVTCRAVAHLSTVSEYAFPFLKIGGLFITQKGPAGMDEIDEGKGTLKILGGKLDRIKEFILPGGAEKRCIFVFRKVRETPTEYPRRNGIPAKKPLHTLNVPRGTLRDNARKGKI